MTESSDAKVLINIDISRSLIIWSILKNLWPLLRPTATILSKLRWALLFGGEHGGDAAIEALRGLRD